MATATHHTTSRGMYFAPITAWVHMMQARFARYRNFRRTLDELSGLSAHQLADLGLNRSMLRQAAYQAAYCQGH